MNENKTAAAAPQIDQTAFQKSLCDMHPEKTPKKMHHQYFTESPSD